MVKFNNDWDNLLQDEFKKDYYLKLRQFLINEYKTKKVYPEKDNIFNALKYTSYKDARVLILGQDPYHGENQAHGLAFSVKPGVKIPPSLQNMYKELKDELGLFIPNNGYLKKWADQGVLLLNASLTVAEGQPNSHQKIGWQIFTDRVIEILNDRLDPMIFILWGNYARSKNSYITNKRHFILEAVHPSPLSASRGFFGCGHFEKVNEILVNMGKKPIDWQIENI